MKIHIHNTIHMAGETEIINEVHECEWTLKGDNHYLVYRNEEDEKVVIKIGASELIMNRFSTPKSTMRFTKDELDIASIPTPLGVQRLLTRTDKFRLDHDQNKLFLSYDLLTDPDSTAPLASYKMMIQWQ